MVPSVVHLTPSATQEGSRLGPGRETRDPPVGRVGGAATGAQRPLQPVQAEAVPGGRHGALGRGYTSHLMAPEQQE